MSLAAGLTGDLEEGPTSNTDSVNMAAVPCCERVALGVLRFLMSMLALVIGVGYLLLAVLYDTGEGDDKGAGAFAFGGINGPALVWAALLAPPYLTCAFLLLGDLFKQLLITYATPIGRGAVMTVVGLLFVSLTATFSLYVVFFSQGGSASLLAVGLILIAFVFTPILVVGAATRAVCSHKKLHNTKSRMAMLVRLVC